MKLYLTVDKNGEEKAWDIIPQRGIDFWYSNEIEYISLPKNTINVLINKNLTWDDEPYLYDLFIPTNIYDVKKSKKIQIIYSLIALIQFACILGVLFIDNTLIDTCIILFQMLLICIMIAVGK